MGGTSQGSRQAPQPQSGGRTTMGMALAGEPPPQRAQRPIPQAQPQAQKPRWTPQQIRDWRAKQAGPAQQYGGPQGYQIAPNTFRPSPGGFQPAPNQYRPPPSERNPQAAEAMDPRQKNAYIQAMLRQGAGQGGGYQAGPNLAQQYSMAGYGRPGLQQEPAGGMMREPGRQGARRRAMGRRR